MLPSGWGFGIGGNSQRRRWRMEDRGWKGFCHPPPSIFHPRLRPHFCIRYAATRAMSDDSTLPADVSPAAYETPELERPATASPTEGQLEASTHDPYAAFRYPSFLRYQLGWVVSIVGQQIQSVA